MTETQQKELMEQVLLMYEEFASDGTHTDYFAQLLNGLFDIAKDIAPDDMHRAFGQGMNWSRR